MIFSVESLPFFSKLSIFNKLLVLKKCSYKIHSNWCNSLWIHINCSAMFVTHDDTMENEPKTFVIVKTAIFLKWLFLPTSYVPKKGSYHLHNKCQKTSRTLIKFSLSFVMLDKTEERRAKPFHHWKVCLFLFKNLFPTTYQILENCFYKFFSNCHKSLWTIIKCFLSFVTLSNTRKKGQKFLSSWKRLFLKCLFLSTS